ncbi:MAG: hypothetical protein U0470_10260 [Anaerolineae bacterium]
MGHYPHFLDYSVEERSGVRGVTNLSYSLDSPPEFEDLQSFPIPDGLVHVCDAAERLDEVLDIVNAVASRPLIRYGAYQAWFTELDSGDFKSRYGQEMYNHPDIGSPDAVEPTPDVDFHDEIVLALRDDEGDGVQIVHMRDLLNVYFSAADSDSKRLFRSACRVAARARRISQFDLSTSFLLLVSSIEALIHLKHRDMPVVSCKECGQDRYRVARKFKDFLEEYCYEIDAKARDRIYKLRSALVHRGQVLPLEVGPAYYIETANDLKARYDATLSHLDYFRTSDVTTACFRMFLFREFAVSDAA